MLVTERMRSLGDHARSSRQPPLKERRRAKADESAAKQDVIDDTILENDTTHESAVAVIVDDVTPQIVMHESSNDDAVAEVSPIEDATQIATTVSVAAEAGPQPAAADDSATQTEAVQEDANLSAAKRAIVHEWENWSALHSDELGDPNVAEYFFRHLQQKRSKLLDFSAQNKCQMIRGWLAD